jgi:hypothetical protein
MTSFEFDALVESTRSTDPDLFEAQSDADYEQQCRDGEAMLAAWERECPPLPDIAAIHDRRDAEQLAQHLATVDAIDEYLQHRAAEPTWRRRALDPEAEGVALQWRHGTDLTGYLRSR